MDKYFYEAFCTIPRGGPGNVESTRKALAAIKNLPQSPKIIDIGCGSGIQTMELAKLTGGSITAFDNYEPYRDIVNQKAEDNGLSSSVNFIVGDMFKMDFPVESFDLVWSEGAIFIVGFENGLRDWKKYIKPGGYLAVSEISLFTPNPPKEVYDYFKNMCPDMADYESNRKIIESYGYRIIYHFELPKAAWLDDFYIPLQEKVISMREKYSNIPEAQNTLDSIQAEIDIYEKYSDYYGYIFYIMQKNK